MQNVNVSDDLR
jgi:hypothetical protein